ncbi:MULTISPECIES: lipocalin family protein [Elizabethkingia]|uniref:Lipocalin-like domain-containing protein n=1 Tax=Elizabethkingia ursingii TaxID=1756150 RepID=A0AAJ3NEV7_9FLAO|nr:MULTISPECIES: lipocalin family protein [Elizabethkingia]AQW92909.1 hypothetical protein BBD30_01220 [Elizabethkingia anophelis]AQX09801.1 hypothetical protein BBD34_14650 [Elizabethkingia ursingii]OPB60828.1 hypothetical protein BAS07_17605 [Elizabethkingia anophelis]OPB78946.1 hypothetical protein BAY32_19005 [Elizabethkingia ursingii]OPB91622.1 hypothetical protein BB021_17055 [Elizabethkingia ursingii]
MTKLKNTSIILLALCVACKSPSSKESETLSPDSLTPEINKEKLFDKWYQPIPGQEPELQGIELKQNGTASSINTHTLKYDKWKLSKDTLFLWSHSEGVKERTEIIDVFLIKKLTNSELILSPLKGDSDSEQRYTNSIENSTNEQSH